MEKLEKELIELIRNYKLPDVNKCAHSSCYEHTADGFLDDDVIFYFLKFEDSQKTRHWTLARVYKGINNYTDEKYKQILEQRIMVLKSVFENPNSAQYKKMLP